MTEYKIVAGVVFLEGTYFTHEGEGENLFDNVEVIVQNGKKRGYHILGVVHKPMNVEMYYKTVPASQDSIDMAERSK